MCSLANAVNGCSAATCLIASCNPGFADLDHVPGNGCEYACPVFPPVAEACNGLDDNGLDDDCDGVVDNATTCAIAASFVPDQPSPASNTVAMSQGPRSFDVVTVNVTMTGTNGVYATALEVVYDATHTSYLGFSPGSVFEQGGNTPQYQVSDHASTTPARIIVGISRNGGTATNVVGTKTILGLQFRVNQSGVYPVAIQNSVVYDNQPTPQPIPGILWFVGALQGV